MKRKIYIFHEFGSNSHYRALSWYASTSDKIELHFREFSVLKFFVKSILKRDWKLLNKQLINLKFLVSLIFTRDKEIIVGIAPYDFRLLLYYPFLQRHTYYYHTSKTTWGYVNYSKKWLAKSKISKRTWKNFINNASGVFCVTQKAKDEILKFYNPKAVEVVYHSIAQEYVAHEQPQCGINETIQCLFVGRLEESKGLNVLFNLIDDLPTETYKFNFVGNGNMEAEVTKFVASRTNTSYLGKLSGAQLRSVYDKADVLLAPSIKTGPWEELFGMVLIEAMSRATIPIATDHSGPKEIIADRDWGYVIPESKYQQNAKNILATFQKDRILLEKIKKNTFERGQSFSPNYIFDRWNKILKILK